MNQDTGKRSRRRRLLTAGAIGTAAALAVVIGSMAGNASPKELTPVQADGFHTDTPIKHVVVIFGENISFDHYFGTYPHAANTDGTRFTAAPNTPRVNGLTPELLTHNPNAYNPKRLSPSQALTCD